MPVYVGIDPGAKGGMAALFSGSRSKGSALLAGIMPQTDRDILDQLEGLRGAHAHVVAVIEQVHSFPGQGVASTFKFGCGYGALRMALTACRIPYEEVTPRKWQAALGIPSRKRTESKTEWKNRLKAKAQQLFPSVKVTLAIADALLIANYCQRKHEGTL